MNDRQKALLSIFTYSVLAGAIAAITKIGLSQIPPFSFAFIRFLLASFIVAPFIFKKRKSFVRDMKILLPFSIFATINIIFFATGIKLTTADISQILYTTVPILTGALAYFMLGDKLSLRKISGIAVGFIGASLALFVPILAKGEKFSGNLLGNVLLIIAVISWSIYMILSKKAQKTHSIFHITAVFIIVTTFVLFPFFLFESVSYYGWWDKIGFSAIASLIYMVLGGTIATYLLNQYAIRHGGAVFASMTFYLTPIFGFTAAFIILGETLSSLLFFGAILSLIGVFLTTSR
ncbi:MAG: DMT family transporter [Patescibacteria group bacterium]|nr:DMT family transporter [Patescibacteria group bacterium]MCL6096514.1 DMT family transporter [Patescibacteria group bacterium]